MYLIFTNNTFTLYLEKKNYKIMQNYNLCLALAQDFSVFAYHLQMYLNWLSIFKGPRSSLEQMES